MIRILLAAVCLVAQPGAAQTLTVADALALRDRAEGRAFAGRAEWNALTFYLQGAVEAAMAYQDALEAEGARPLFCPPENHAESVETLFTTLGRTKETDRARSAVSVILESYAKKYPC